MGLEGFLKELLEGLLGWVCICLAVMLRVTSLVWRGVKLGVGD